MGRFMYVHFGDDVPRNIEKEYNKLLRKERYLEERDAENGLIYPNLTLFSLRIPILQVSQ